MKTMLKDSNVVLPGVRRIGHRQWFLLMAGEHFSTKDSLVRGPPLEARVDHGRWIVDCPHCKGAECVTLDDPVFLCLSCGNEAVGGKLYRVKFPPPARRRKLEALLAERPLFGQNWDPSISLTRVRTENEIGFHQSWTTPRTWTTGELVTAAMCNTHIRDNLNVCNPSAVEFLLDGGGAAISSGSYCRFEVPYNCTVARWTLIGDGNASSIEVEIWAVSFAGFPPASEDDITATSPMTIASGASGQDTNPSTWSTMTAGEIGVVHVVGCSGIQKCTVSLILDKD